MLFFLFIDADVGIPYENNSSSRKNVMIYGQENDESVIAKYLDAHIESGITQKNLDKILDIIDDYSMLW